VLPVYTVFQLNPASVKRENPMPSTRRLAWVYSAGIMWETTLANGEESIYSHYSWPRYTSRPFRC